MSVVAVVGKGGSGKTTAAACLAALASADGAECVLVDLDSTSTLTTWLAPHLDEDAATVDDVLTGDSTVDKVTAGVRDHLRLVPASRGLVRIEGERTIHHAVQAVVDELREAADLVLLDCRGGTANRLASAAVTAADGVVMPFEPSPMSQTPIIDAGQVLEALSTPLLGLLPNRGRGTVVGRRFTDWLNSGGFRLLPHVRQDIRAAEAVAAHRLLDDYAPRCNAMVDYRAVYAELNLLGKG